MFISDIDIYALRESGFNDYELSVFSDAPAPIDLSEPAWANAMESRRQWIEQQIDKGRSESEIQALIMDYYYTVDKASPFDWLREAYGLPDFVSPLQSDPEKYGDALRRMREREAEAARQRTAELKWRGA